MQKVFGFRHRPDIEIVKFTSEARQLILDHHESGMTIYAIAKEMGVTSGSVAQVLRIERKRKAHYDGNIPSSSETT